MSRRKLPAHRAGTLPDLTLIGYHDPDMQIHNPATTSNEAPRSIAFLLVERFALISYASAVEPLRAANLLACRRLYALRHYAIQGVEARASRGAVVPCDGEAGASFRPPILLVFARGARPRYSKAARLPRPR